MTERRPRRFTNHSTRAFSFGVLLFWVLALGLWYAVLGPSWDKVMSSTPAVKTPVPGSVLHRDVRGPR